MSAFTCAICRESLGVGSLSKACTVPCGHVFHDHCIYNWLERSQTCPHCRVSAAPDQVIKLYFDLADESQVSDIESLRLENQSLKVSLERTQNDLKTKIDEIAGFRGELEFIKSSNDLLRRDAKNANSKLARLKNVKLECNRSKTELRLALTALENQRAKVSLLSKDLKKLQKINTLMDGSAVEASNVITSEECVDFDTMKVCFITMKRDFQILRQSEVKLKTDFSKLFNAYKALKRTNASLEEKISMQERILETYRIDASSSPRETIPNDISKHSNMDVDETNVGPASSKVIPRRSPRNIMKRSLFNDGKKNPRQFSRQLSYDGLGGHSSEDTFPTAKLRPCRIVSNRRK